MEGVCIHCSHVLEYSGEPPRFCGYCGNPLEPGATMAHPPIGQTLEYNARATGLADEATLVRSTAPPEVVGGYRILQLLGSGGMGAVYEAEEPVQKKRVALKLVSAQYIQSPETLQRFRREGLLASSLVHPRCVFVLAADEDAGRPYIVMELMPGRTLQDLVRERGPLRPVEAITKILDVMEGLEEAHDLGVVHRDVKPSNCFLEENGRVKIGDFGLAKSLARDAGLTRTGAFMGTPQYAAPEQIKAETVDSQSDVYSVAATLYFLLVGRAPFEGADPVATMAAIVSEAPPTLRSLQARLSPKLDRAVLRGLERDRKRRWQNLDEFRQALTALLPSEPSIAGLGLRFSAYLFDFLVLVVAVFLPCSFLLKNPAVNLIVVSTLDILYFGISEGFWGQSPGKWLFGLRVLRKETLQVPGFLRAVWRAALVEMCWELPTVMPEIWSLFGTPEVLAEVLGILELGPIALLLLVTMRRRNNYRGVHEFLSGTVTAALSGRRRRRLVKARGVDTKIPLTSPADLPEKIGSFRILGAVRWDATEKVLLAEDQSLGRVVWIWRREQSEPLPAARHALDRTARLRWLATVELDQEIWECFVGPTGTPLPELRTSEEPLSWEAARPLLEELIDELVAGKADGTLPDRLEGRQIWVQPTGRILVVDIPYVASSIANGAKVDANLATLRDAARAILAAPPKKGPLPTVAAPLPVHARRLLDRLLGEPLVTRGGKILREPYRNFDEFREVMRQTHDLPIEVSRVKRGQQLTIMMAMTHLTSGAPLVWFAATLLLLIAEWLERRGIEMKVDAGAGRMVVFYMLGVLAVWCAWSFLLRGGLSYRLTGIHLSRRDGRKAARWQCALRVLLVWSPIVLIQALAILVHAWFPEQNKLALALWLGSVLLIPAYIWSALRSPGQALYDRILGVYLVPN